MLDTIMTYLEGYPFLKEMVKMMTKFKSIRKKPENTKTLLLQDMHYCTIIPYLAHAAIQVHRQKKENSPFSYRP